MNSNEEKSAALIESVVLTAKQIAGFTKLLPSGKLNRNVFIKSYNRRLRNKHKRVSAMFNIGMSAFMAASKVARIMQQPVPKFPKGSLGDDKIVNADSIFHRLGGKYVENNISGKRLDY